MHRALGKYGTHRFGVVFPRHNRQQSAHPDGPYLPELNASPCTNELKGRLLLNTAFPKNKQSAFGTSSIIYLFFEVMMVTTIVMPIWETMFGVLNMILGKVTSTLWL